MNKDRLIKVIFPPLETEFDYISNSEALQSGQEIAAPFGRQTKHGYIIQTQDLLNPPERDLTRIDQGNICKSLFSTEQLKFFQWIANYYQEPLANVIKVAAPKYFPDKYEKIFRIDQPVQLKGKKQQAILDYVGKHKEVSQKKILEKYPQSHSVLKRLLDLKALSLQENKIEHLTENNNLYTEASRKQLNTQQSTALKKISQAAQDQVFAPFLLYGITGSGKTEVYLEIAEQVLQKGQGVMVIVPEISLTPQLIDRFQERLNYNFAILHSALKATHRWNYWQQLLEGKINIVIGVRSAVFAPMKNLGLIIIDEEHDASLKQSDGFRYHARDLAVKRAQLNNCPIILGSATPSLESLHNANQKKYQFLKLSERYAKSQNLNFEIINLRETKKSDRASDNISAKLFEAIQGKIENREQVFLLYNRLGFASYLRCNECGCCLNCQNCDVTLTFYEQKEQLLCHFCGYQPETPDYCPECQTGHTTEPTKWVKMGAGTERIEQELRTLFPDASIDRLDRDNITSHESYKQILDKVRRQETQILLGTQMIAKGHDLPGVTLVGIINADIGLHLPDFRASEKNFQLLQQASGRAGRRELPGSVIIQTYLPDHPSIKYVAQNNFQSFVNEELTNRLELSYPPYSKILRVIISAPDELQVQKYAGAAKQRICDIIEKKHLKLTTLGPVAPPISKLRQHFRQHFIFKGQSLSDLLHIVQFFKHEKQKRRNFRIVYDLDPYDML